MNASSSPSRFTRRSFLKSSGAGVTLLSLPMLGRLSAAPTRPASDARRTLVIVRLAGGNDGLNTVVPFDDANYRRLRPSLALEPSSLLRVNDALGLHPACAGLHTLLQEGKLGIVQAVGYPNPSYSHFRAAEIWETATAGDCPITDGWIDRLLAAGDGAATDASAPPAVAINRGADGFFAPGGADVYDLRPGGRVVRAAEALPAPTPESTDDPFAAALRQVVTLIAQPAPARVFQVTLDGFDTHSDQLARHDRLLQSVSDGLLGFQRDLEARHLASEVLTLTISEFGRRPGENFSYGTEHGTSAPVFVMGSRINGPLHGVTPSLFGLGPEDQLGFSTDFRRVYATILERWFETDSQKILGGRYPSLTFLG